MALTPGTRLGPYEVIAPIGVGGMGEVYRATDTNLKRSVAIKVLPASMAADAERLARFQREAELLAALNHPNIAAIYGLEKNNGITALAMELVEGSTLADRIAQGALPVDEALPIARQIAAALEAAHEQGIIHRDLKPANIKLRPDGTVKVLDFGLAKVMEPAAVASASLSHSPTLTTPMMTGVGMILGTAAYMSPEQARGRPVDKRADIWAFGCVFYEMLTGRALFAGDTATDVIAGVVTREPDWIGVPRTVKRLLEKCLHKDPRQRLRDVGDAWLLLESGETQGAAPDGAFDPSRRWKQLVPWAVAALVAVVAAITIVDSRDAAPQPLDVVRFQLQVALEAGSGTPEISPNGRHIVYQTSQGIFVRDLDAVEPRLLATTDNPVGRPFWSSDSRSIAYATSTKLMRVDATGGPPQSICDLPGILLGGLWLAGDRILIRTSQSVQAVHARGGPVTRAALSPSSISGGSQTLPDGNRFVYVNRQGAEGERGIFVGRIDGTGEPVRLLPDSATEVAFVAAPEAPGGYVLFQRQGSLMAQALDSSGAELSGDPVVVATDVQSFTASANGTLVYLGAAEGRRLTWFDRTGRSTGTAWAPGFYLEVSLSPDASRVAVVRADALRADAAPTTWLHDFSREASTKLVQRGNAVKPIWSPDGSRLAYAEGGGGLFDLSGAASTGEDSGTPLLESPALKYPDSWSYDGKWLLYTNVDPMTREDLWVLSMAQGGKPAPEPFLVTSFSETDAAFSPDGRRVAYVSNESGVPEVYVRAFPAGTAGKWTISTGGGYQPRWNRSGRELLYMSGKGEFMSVDVAVGDSFSATNPRRLFSVPIFGGGASLNNRYWDMTPDGQRFLVTTTADGRGTSTLTVVLNWQSALRQ